MMDFSFSLAMLLDLAELHGLGSGTLLMPALDLPPVASAQVFTALWGWLTSATVVV